MFKKTIFGLGLLILGLCSTQAKAEFAMNVPANSASVYSALYFGEVLSNSVLGVQNATGADAETVVVRMPINPAVIFGRGQKLKKVKVNYTVTTAPMDDEPEFALVRIKNDGDGVPTSTSLTTTLSECNDSAADGIAVNTSYTCVLTLSTAENLDKDATYQLTITPDNAATSILRFTSVSWHGVGE